MRRIVIALGVIVGIFFIVRAVVELLTIDYSDPSSYEDDWRTEPRGRAAGSLWVGTDRRDLDRRLSVATTFELIEGARAMNRATRCVCWRVRLLGSLHTATEQDGPGSPWNSTVRQRNGHRGRPGPDWPSAATFLAVVDPPLPHA
ncbi:MAG TPA: hypothetical protein VKB32_03110 [Actinomycetota bacterium]|nr:hypothetical protein [Actinomycetota bacterium]